jgi:hypothetical protein
MNLKKIIALTIACCVIQNSILCDYIWKIKNWMKVDLDVTIAASRDQYIHFSVPGNSGGSGTEVTQTTNFRGSFLRVNKLVTTNDSQPVWESVIDTNIVGPCQAGAYFVVSGKDAGAQALLGVYEGNLPMRPDQTMWMIKRRDPAPSFISVLSDFFVKTAQDVAHEVNKESQTVANTAQDVAQGAAEGAKTVARLTQEFVRKTDKEVQKVLDVEKQLLEKSRDLLVQTSLKVAQLFAKSGKDAWNTVKNIERKIQLAVEIAALESAIQVLIGSRTTAQGVLKGVDIGVTTALSGVQQGLDWTVGNILQIKKVYFDGSVGDFKNVELPAVTVDLTVAGKSMSLNVPHFPLGNMERMVSYLVSVVVEQLNIGTSFVVDQISKI